MRIVTIFTSLVLVVLMSAQGMSQSLARESFEYPATIAGKGTATNGFGGPWVIDPTDTGVEGLAVLAGNVFNYDNLNYAIPDTGNHIQVTKKNAWSDHQRYKRPLAAAWPNVAGRKYWVSYLLDVKEPLPVGNTYFMVKLYANNGANELLAIGKGGGRDNNPPVFTCGSGWPGQSGADVSAVEITAGPVWLVVRIDMSGGTGPERTFMWVDPDPAGGEPDTSTAAVKRNSSMPNGFDTIALEFGGDGQNVKLIFDEIRLAASFADLTSPTPQEPAARESFEFSATLAGLGTATNGFGGPWVIDPTDTGVEGLAVPAGNVFNYDNLNYVIPDTGNHIQVTKKNAWSDHQRYKRPLAAAWPNVAGQKYWVSYLLDVKEPLPVGNTYFMVKLYANNGANELLAIGKGGGRDNNPPVFTCGSGWPGQSGADVSAVEITAGPVWLVVRIDMSGGTGTERTFMWVDPDPAGGDPDTSTAIVKRNSSMPNGFDTIALEFGGDGQDVQLVFDEIRLATSFAALSSAITSVTSPDIIPVQFGLSQNYPNPFNPETKIHYSLKSHDMVRLSVYDLMGREVAVLVEGIQNAGSYTVTFSGAGLQSGIYFYRLETPKEVITRKMVLTR